MLANYHTHTSRCRHATGTDEEYIQKAIAEGVKILGFSDHAPYLYPDGYKSYYKMTPEESAEYFSSLSALREKYRGKIKIHIGYEAEYYSELWEPTFDFWKNQPIRPEYLILGQHFTKKEWNEKTRLHSYAGSDSPDALSHYVDVIAEGLSTRKFSALAHPDLFSYFGANDFFAQEMHRLLTEIKKTDIPIELNLLGMAEGRRYPNPLFWEIASEYNPKVFLGCDAHEPERIAVKEEIAEALRFADKYKLEIIDNFTLVNPFE